MKKSTLLLGAYMVLCASSTALFAEGRNDPQLTSQTLRSASAEEPDLVYFWSGAHVAKRVVTSTKPVTSTSTDFEKLKGARLRVRLPIGSAFLINTSFAAETRCMQRNSTRANWCEASIQINGDEAEPAASSNPPDTFAMDSTNSGGDGIGSWEAHGFDRHACVRGSTPSVPRYADVIVYVRVTNQNSSEPLPRFWIDDWSLVVEAAQGCYRREFTE